MAIDTLGYVKKREAAGVDRKVAAAHMVAISRCVVSELVTKMDLDRAL